jgi:hypothetical protein
MAGEPELATQSGSVRDVGVKSFPSLDAELIIANVPDPLFVSEFDPTRTFFTSLTEGS